MLKSMQHLDPHVWPDSAHVQADGSMVIGGCTVRELAATYGTPLYVLDLQTVQATAQAYLGALREHYPGEATVHYASKALLNTAVAQLMTRAGLGLDCVSLGEVAVALRAGVDPGLLHLHGNAKPRHELEQALAWGVGRIIVDSLDELQLLAELTSERRDPYPVLLRLNPGVDVHTHAHIQTGQLDSKFGLPVSTGMANTAVRMLTAAPGLRLVGLHAHLGSQIHELDALVLGMERLLDVAASIRTEYGITIEELSPGGGLAVAYRPGDPAPTVAAYVTALAQALLEGCARRDLPLPRLIVEPGRSLIARAIVAVYSVLSVKRIPAVRTYVAVDGGMGDNLRPSLYDARYTVRAVDAMPAEDSETITIAGRFCESGDLLVRDVALPPLDPGTLLAVAQAGAYTLSMASNYNLVSRPALVLVADGAAHLLQRRETVEDLVARDLRLPSSIAS